MRQSDIQFGGFAAFVLTRWLKLSNAAVMSLVCKTVFMCVQPQQLENNTRDLLPHDVGSVWTFGQKLYMFVMIEFL